MEFMGSKGQGAIEYLATYGWAILIIAVIGVVIWQMGLFNPPSPPPDCRGFSQVRPLDWKYKVNGDFTVVLVNEANTKLNVTDVAFTMDGQSGSCSDSSDVSMRAGSKAMYNLSCGPATFNFGSGDYYKAKINITYKNIASDMDHTSVGSCWGDAE